MGKLKTIALGLLPLVILLICLRSCNELDRPLPPTRSGTTSVVSTAGKTIARRVGNRILSSAVDHLRSAGDASPEYEYRYLLDEGHFNHRESFGTREKVLSLTWHPGAQAFYPYGIGADIRFLRIKDFGAQAGVAYFTEKKEATWSLGGSYRLNEVTRGWTQNTWIFASYTPKTIIAGIRIDL